MSRKQEERVATLTAYTNKILSLLEDIYDLGYNDATQAIMDAVTSPNLARSGVDKPIAALKVGRKKMVRVGKNMQEVLFALKDDKEIPFGRAARKSIQALTNIGFVKNGEKGISLTSKGKTWLIQKAGAEELA